MPRLGVASLAREDLPLRGAVMLTRTVCSLLRASCLFSRFSCCFFTLPFHTARLQAAESGLKSKAIWSLRATASKYRESADSEENSDFLLLRQKDPFGGLFSEIYFQSSSKFTFL